MANQNSRSASRSSSNDWNLRTQTSGRVIRPRLASWRGRRPSGRHPPELYHSELAQSGRLADLSEHALLFAKNRPMPVSKLLERCDPQPFEIRNNRWFNPNVGNCRQPNRTCLILCVRQYRTCGPQCEGRIVSDPPFANRCLVVQSTSPKSSISRWLRAPQATKAVAAARPAEFAVNGYGQRW